MQYSSIEDILPLVEKPGRYIGGEINAAQKDRTACRLTVALAFPDTYEIGMSHLGLQILYAILNDIPGVAAERVFAPWPDMESFMRLHDIPLGTLESGASLSKFDIVGFSLQYELSYTNVLNMLDMGKIPLYAADRGKGMPIVITGGPCTFNPRPMAPFFDAFVIGEGEEVIEEIARAVMKGNGGSGVPASWISWRGSTASGSPPSMAATQRYASGPWSIWRSGAARLVPSFPSWGPSMTGSRSRSPGAAPGDAVSAKPG